MPKIYLTIDDSPTPFTDEMTDYLVARNIPALLYLRMHMAEDYGTDCLIRAIHKGFILANHAYSHTHFQTLGYDTLVEEILKSEKIIDDLYAQAGAVRSGKYFRFPHLDRGAGGYVVNYDAYTSEHKDFVTKLFTDGVRVELNSPTDEQLIKKEKMQAFLKSEGFTQPFENVTYPWFTGTEMETAADCLYTFSTSDWMLLDRYRGKYKYKSIDDLKQKLDDDPWLHKSDSNAIILIHDKPDPEFPEIFKSLIDHMVDSGYEFLSYDN